MWVTGNKQLHGKHFSLLGEFKAIQVHTYLEKYICTNGATFFVWLLNQNEIFALIVNLKRWQEKFTVTMYEQGLLSHS